MPITGLQLITVTGKYLMLDGTPATGSVTFSTNTVIVNTVANEIVFPRELVAPLNAAGSFSVQIPATNDPDLAPTGFTYTVTEQIRNSPDRSYDISLAYDLAGATVDMADVVPAVPVGTITHYVLQSTLDAHDASLTAHGGTFVPAVGGTFTGDVKLSPESTAVLWGGEGGAQNNPPWRMYSRDSNTDPNDQTLITSYNFIPGPTRDDNTKPSIRWGLEPNWFGTMEWNLDVYGVTDTGFTGRRLFMMTHFWDSVPEKTHFEWWGSTWIHPRYDEACLTIRGNSGAAQTFPYFQVWNNAGTTVLDFTPAGQLRIGDLNSPGIIERNAANSLRMPSTSLVVGNNLEVGATTTLKGTIVLARTSTDHTFQRDADNKAVTIAGGTSISAGGGFQLFGPTHATSPSLVRVLENGTVILTAGPAGLTMQAGYPVLTAASATAKAGLRIPHGAAPTSPVDGDIWTTTAGLFVRINGTTRLVAVV